MLNNLPVNSGDTGDMGLVPVLGRNGNPFQYSFLENFMDRKPDSLQLTGLKRVPHN